MSEENETVQIKGHKIELPEGRYVSVGKVGGDTSYYMMMRNAQGEETTFKISPEAAKALQDLLTVMIGNEGWTYKVVSA